MDWQIVGNYIIDHIEYGILLTAPLIFMYLYKKRISKKRNNLTRFIIEYKRFCNSINEQSKGLMKK